MKWINILESFAVIPTTNFEVIVVYVMSFFAGM